MDTLVKLLTFDFKEAKKQLDEMAKSTDGVMDKLTEMRRREELANAPNERARLITRLRQEREELSLNTTNAIQLQEELRQHRKTAAAEIAQLDRQQAEARKKEIEAEQEAIAQARITILSRIEAQRIETIETKYGAAAAQEYAAAIQGDLIKAFRRLSAEEGRQLRDT